MKFTETYSAVHIKCSVISETHSLLEIGNRSIGALDFSRIGGLCHRDLPKSIDLR